MSNLGSAYAELKRYDEARTRFEQAVAIRSSLNGQDHMELAHTQTMFATLDLERSNRSVPNELRGRSWRN